MLLKVQKKNFLGSNSFKSVTYAMLVQFPYQLSYEDTA